MNIPEFKLFQCPSCGRRFSDQATSACDICQTPVTVTPLDEDFEQSPVLPATIWSVGELVDVFGEPFQVTATRRGGFASVYVLKREGDKGSQRLAVKALHPSIAI